VIDFFKKAVDFTIIIFDFMKHKFYLILKAYL
jgi:hypothetical protein